MAQLPQKQQNVSMMESLAKQQTSVSQSNNASLVGCRTVNELTNAFDKLLIADQKINTQDFYLQQLQDVKMAIEKEKTGQMDIHTSQVLFAAKNLVLNKALLDQWRYLFFFVSLCVRVHSIRF